MDEGDDGEEDDDVMRHFFGLEIWLWWFMYV